ncbi:ATP-binding protein [Nitrococcus mobilis]|uniref:AAA ATPase n=1 Tax=Nitrococcus mobilis Nb-231 TaxID=314278 RepID=A4BR03_9GAMM|nr:ATP-binding protein [Nitrococcus mobilis]EAR22003.1 AAA ATPase [Nitrococcus mobilis Nb-231]
MNKSPGRTHEAVDPGLSPAERLALESAILAGRLLELLKQTFSQPDGSLASALSFLEASFQQAARGRPLAIWQGTAAERRSAGAAHPLDRLADGLGLSSCEVDLLLLAGLPEQHEGYADVLRALHPLAVPAATVGLAAQLFCRDADERHMLRELLHTGPAVTAGALRIAGEGPLVTRSLLVADTLWPVLGGIDAWPEAVRRREIAVGLHGLAHWLREPPTEHALSALASGMACIILLSAEDERVARHRAAALTQAAGLASVIIDLPPDPTPAVAQLIGVHALARGVVPILCLGYRNEPTTPQVPACARYPGPVLVCARPGGAAIDDLRPLLEVSCERLGPSALRSMWRGAMPELRGQAALLAARYPAEPASALAVATDARARAQWQGRRPNLDDVAASVRARAGASLQGGVKRLRPLATWEQLVLPGERLEQLREAIDRLIHQVQVLEDWGFLGGRAGARGVRLLFSGPPGTGKTLAAEVMARALAVDLLVVDLSRVVSKWLGETEKNLAEVFDTAEKASAVLFFDEADALFGRRTEISDAHDRYANLETAYLLARLERFEGLAILATNHRQNIDPAFLRRLEALVEFPEPGREERLALWRCHLPPKAPLAEDVRLTELAAHFPVVGGLIRNAAVAAAFLAAANASPVTRQHLLRAVQREYEKSGKAFPGMPGGEASTSP